MTDEPPRDPSHYHLSTHAYQRRKDRGIKWSDIVDTIRDGIHQPARGGPPIYEFLYFPIGADEAVGVVADISNGTVKTVYWAFDCDHPKVDEWREERQADA